MSSNTITGEVQGAERKVRDLAVILAIALLFVGSAAILARRDTNNFRKHAPAVAIDYLASSDRLVPEIRSVSFPSFTPGQKSVAVELAEEAIIRAGRSSDLERDAIYSSFWDLLAALEFRGKSQSTDIAFKAFLASALSTPKAEQARILNYLDRSLFPALDEYLRRRDYPGARRLTRRACSWFESYNTSPVLASDFPRLQAAINAIYRLDAAIESLDVVFQQQEGITLIIDDSIGAKRLEPQSIKFLNQSTNQVIRAWAQYSAGAQALANRNFGEAGKNFSTAAMEAGKDPGATRLRELALLGRARAAFWDVNLGQGPSDSARRVLLNSRDEMKSTRFKPDIDFYLKHLGEKSE